MPDPGLIVIGGNAAGLSAASAARRTDPALPIRVFERGRDISYSACGIPYYLSGDIPDIQSLMVYDAGFFDRERRITVGLEHTVREIRPGKRAVVVDTPSGSHEFSYRSLVIATGAEPVHPNVPGADLPGVFSVRTLADGRRIKTFLDRVRPGSAVIAGGGFLGLEMAEAMARCGCRVTIIEKNPDILHGWHSGITEMVRRGMDAEGWQLLTRMSVDRFTGGSSGVTGVILSDGRCLDADIVILGMGVRPAAGLARDAGISLCSRGAVAVNERMETSRPGIYAAGDCAMTRNVITGGPAYLPLGTTANKQGKFAGINAAGGRDSFPGVTGTAVVKIGGMAAARTGLTFQDARDNGFNPVTEIIEHHDKAGYWNPSGTLRLALTADKHSGRLLGAEIAGRGEIAKRIDGLAIALTNRMTVQEMRYLDLSYAPPFAPAWDPVLIAANVLWKALS